MKTKLLKFFKNPHFLFLLIISILGIISSFSLFKNNKVLVGLDTWPPLNIELRMKEWPYMWGYFSSMLGADFSNRIVFLPEVLIYYLLHLLGFSLLASQKIVFTQIFLLAGWSMYFLGYTILKKPLSAFTTAIVFTFSPVFTGFWQQFLPQAINSFVGFPLVLAVFLRGLKSPSTFKSAILLSLTTLLILPYNPPTYVVEIGIIFLFFLFKFIFSERKLAMIKFSVVSIFLSILINIWWIAPLVGWFPDFVSYNEQEMTFHDRLVIQGVRAELPNTIRLMGSSYWGYSMWGEKPSNILSFIYLNSPALTFLSFIYPVFAFWALLLHKREKNVLFWSLSSLLFLFLAKGLNRPFGFIYEFLYNKFPGFFIFRTPSDKFWLAVLFFYSLLIGVSVSAIYLSLKRTSALLGKGVVAIILFLFLLFQWPFFTGDIIPNGKSAVPAVEFDYPESFKKISLFLRGQKESFRVLNLPGGNRPTRWIVYNWGFISVYPILSEIFGRPVVDNEPQSFSDIIRSTIYYQLGNYSDISGIIDEKQAKNNSIYKVLGLLNTKYILVNNYVDWQHLFFDTDNPADLEQKLGTQEHIEKGEEFESLHLYSLDKEVIMPEIYPLIPGQEIYFWGKPTRIGNFFSFPDFSFKNGLLVNDKNTSSAENIFISSEYQFYKDDFKRNYFEFPSFPFVRFIPGDLRYPLITLKEKLQKKQPGDFESNFNTDIAFCSKRLAEVKRLIDIRRFNQIYEPINQCETKVDNLVNSFLETQTLSEKNYIYAQDLTRKLSYQENFLSFVSEVLIQNQKPGLESILSRYPKRYSLLKNYLNPWWFDQTAADGQAVYKFNIPKEEEYNIYFNTDDLKSLRINAEGKYLISGILKNRSGQNQEISSSFATLLPDEWVILGRRKLLPGDYVLTFKKEQTENLLSFPSFVSIGKGKISQNVSQTEERSLVYELKVQEKQSAAFYTSFPVSDANDFFRISFSYRSLSGRPFWFTLFKSKLTDFSQEDFLNDFKKNFLSSEVEAALSNKSGIYHSVNCLVCEIPNQIRSLEKDSLWQSLSFNIKAGEGANILGIVFGLDESTKSDVESIIQIKNLRVEKIFNNPTVLRTTKKTVESEDLPELKYKRVNPSRYEIRVKTKNPFDLVFSQTFSPAWDLYIYENKEERNETVAFYPDYNTQELAPESIFFKPEFIISKAEALSRNNHFVINSYANGWKINKTGEYTIVLEFKLQRYFYFIAGISLTTFLVLIFFLVKRKLLN